MDALGIGLVIIGCLFSAVANIWILVLAFKRHIGWGLACFFIPLASVVFIFMNLPRTAIPFVISIVSMVMMVGGYFMSPSMQKASADKDYDSDSKMERLKEKLEKDPAADSESTDDKKDSKSDTD